MKPHLVLLDLALPGTNDLELIRRISNITEAPVILLSGHTEEDIFESAFQAGAADYVAKPFFPSELVARVKAALHRRTASDKSQRPETHELKDMRIDYSQRLVTMAGRKVQLTATEYNLLTEFSTNAGRVLTHDLLLQKLRGYDYMGNPRLLQAFVKTLRRKLGDNARNPSYILTEPRVGYRMPSG